MKRPHDVLRLDVSAFIADAAALDGQWPGADLPRLAELQTPPQDTVLPPRGAGGPTGNCDVPVTGGEAELWLHSAGHTHRCG